MKFLKETKTQSKFINVICAVLILSLLVTYAPSGAYAEDPYSDTEALDEYSYNGYAETPELSEAAIIQEQDSAESRRLRRYGDAVRRMRRSGSGQT